MARWDKSWMTRAPNRRSRTNGLLAADSLKSGGDGVVGVARVGGALVPARGRVELGWVQTLGEQLPEGEHGHGLAGVGNALVPAAGLVELGRVQQLGEASEAVHGASVAGVGGALKPAPGLVE